MLNSLYTEAINKKGKLNEPIEELSESKIDLDENWNEVAIVPSESNHVLAAGDGSYNKKKYLNFNFYAVAAESLIYDPFKTESKLSTVESVELDILPHQSFIDDRLRNMMSIFEIKTALKTFREHKIDYYMDDGSIMGDLIRPTPLEGISQEKKDEIINVVYEKIKNHINDLGPNVSSFRYKEEFKELFEDEELEEYALIRYLESLENLIALKYLLENKGKIIAISKTSSSNELFHANVPDMAILDRFTKKEGFSKPYYRKVSYKVKHDFPIENEFFRNLGFTTVFARLKDYKNIIKIEFPYYIEDEEKIKEILSILKENSTEGYPYLLKKAHKDVVISNQDMSNLSNVIGFIDKSGREMLD